MEGLKYIRLQKGKKAPVDKWRDSSNQFAFDDPHLVTWLESGGNVGFVCGSANVVVLDIDNLDRAEELGIVPDVETRVAKTKRGLHFYLECPDAKKIIFYDLEKIELNKNGQECPLHLGELQCLGQYVVSPPSLHPSGIQYTWSKTAPDEIAQVTFDQIKGWFAGKAAMTAIKVDELRWTNIQDDLPFHIDDVWPEVLSFRKLGQQRQGEHPVHGSSTGGNLVVKGDLWRCFRCNSGGGPLEALAVDAGIIDCIDAHKGCLKNERWFRLCREAKKRGLI